VGFREVSVVEVFEVLRAWLAGLGLRKVAERAGVDRKTARRYVAAAEAAGLTREAGVEALTDELVGEVVGAVRPARPNGHGASWELLLAREEQIRGWVAGEGGREPLSIVKIEELLARQGCVVPYRTLHRFAVERCGFRARSTTVRVADGEPGVECQIDFAQMGFIVDPETGKKRRVHALIFTAVVSRHMFVWLTYSQTLVAVIAGCEAAWRFFGGVFKVLIPDNLKPVVTNADAVNPTLSVGWLDYAQHVGFGTDPARVRSPQDKPRVERAVQYVRGNFWAGETFTSLAEAQERAEDWCRGRAGMRIHGTTQARPAQAFAELEAGCLLPVPAGYDVPVFKQVKVHRDFHVEIARALYSVPEQYLGQRLDARADSELVKLYTSGPAGGRLVKTHPRQPPGGRSTHREDLPEEKTGYALRDLTKLIGVCAAHGESIGIYAERLLDDPLPWTRMRSVYRLQGLVRRYGPGPV
jgi:transposase